MHVAGTLSNQQTTHSYSDFLFPFPRSSLSLRPFLSSLLYLTPACCWDVKQPASSNTTLSLLTYISLPSLFFHQSERGRETLGKEREQEAVKERQRQTHRDKRQRQTEKSSTLSLHFCPSYYPVLFSLSCCCFFIWFFSSLNFLDPNLIFPSLPRPLC